MENSRLHSTILIVEDIDWIRFATKAIVELEGFYAVEATDDAEAIAIAELGSLELILTEEELPTFDILLERIREPPRLRSIPVVIVNPDAADGARLNDAYLIPAYVNITSFLAVRRG